MFNLYLIYERGADNPSPPKIRVKIFGCQCSPQKPKACFKNSTILKI